MKLTVVISAFNEEKKIKNCLESVKWADEIIFVDNSSTDRTAEIAKKYTKKIYTQKNDAFNIDIQKNLGIEKATGDWVLLVDADEVITDELAKEIQLAVQQNDPEISGFQIPRKNIIFGKWIKHSGWYPDLQLRLFRAGLGKYEKKHVHEPLNVQGRVENLNEPFIHYNFETVSQFLYKHLIIYAPNEAEELLRKGYVFDWLGAIRLPMSEFLNRFFAREGYKDGFHGLILALLMGVYYLAIFSYLWEKKGFIEVKDENIIHGLEEEIKKSKKELSYWVNTKEIEQESNILKRTGLKLKRKMNI
jgi:glycosyltransferase involved in cell wall biosynthesis